MAKKAAKKKPATGVSARDERRMKKAVGHEGGKRVNLPQLIGSGAPAPVRVGRANIIPSNGDLPSSMEVAPETVSIGEAMRRAVEELGDVQIDEDLAPSQLRQLAETYEEVVKAQAAFNAKAEAAKIAKKSLESITALLLEKVRACTHPVALPLFDQAEREDDHAEMLAAGRENAEELGLGEEATN